jgi:hypothetical protein
MSFCNGEKFLVLALYLVMDQLGWKAVPGAGDIEIEMVIAGSALSKHELVDIGEWMVIGDCHSECALTMDLYHHLQWVGCIYRIPKFPQDGWWYLIKLFFLAE